MFGSYRGAIWHQYQHAVCSIMHYQRRGELHKGKASVLARLLVLNKADVARWKVSVWRQGRHYGFNGGQRSNISQNDCCGGRREDASAGSAGTWGFASTGEESLLSPQNSPPAWVSDNPGLLLDSPSAGTREAGWKEGRSSSTLRNVLSIKERVC